MPKVRNGATIVDGPPDGLINVNVVDPTSKAGDIFFSKVVGVTSTIAVEGTIDTHDFTASVGHGIEPLDQLVIFDDVADRLYIGCVILGGVSGDVITMDTPFNYTYPAGAFVVRSTRDMKVSGTLASPQIFEVQAPIDVNLHVASINISMFTNNSANLDLFGDQVALTNGLVLRLVNHVNVNYFNVKTNGALAHIAKDVYQLGGAQGWSSEGMGLNIQYAGDSGHGAVIKLAKGDKLQLLIQDDLTTTAGGGGMVEFQASISWHEDEV
jgi:hypothetical protein